MPLGAMEDDDNVKRGVTGTTRKTIAAKAILLAACLAAAAPAAVRAQDVADIRIHTFLTTVHVRCGTYYHVVSACMGDQRDKYVTMGDEIWQRALDATAAFGISKEPISQMVATAKKMMDMETGGDCAKADVLHKKYRSFCEGVYDRKIDMSKWTR